MIKQISVLIENEPGQAYKPINVLGEAGIDVCAVSVGDTEDFGILRMITRDNNNAVNILKKAGFTVNLTDLIGVVVEDHPGGLANLLTVFEKENINIEYFYSFIPRKGEKAIMFFKVEEIDAALDKLKKHNVVLAETIPEV
ncbi:MAG: ACT domain-containing protein [Fibromonadales bacterium]|nr:ACT domain-containing protein [Fibromonadales bacterium]